MNEQHLETLRWLVALVRDEYEGRPSSRKTIEAAEEFLAEMEAYHDELHAIACNLTDFLAEYPPRLDFGTVARARHDALLAEARRILADEKEAAE